MQPADRAPTGIGGGEVEAVAAGEKQEEEGGDAMASALVTGIEQERGASPHRVADGWRLPCLC